MVKLSILVAYAAQFTISFVIAQGPPGINTCSLFQGIFSWLVSILGGAAALYFLIDMFGHVLKSPRDLRAAGLDGLAMVIMLAFAVKSSAFVNWGITLLGGAQAACQLQ